jgi:hypothetical protein
MKRKIQIKSGTLHKIVEAAGITSMSPALSTKILNTKRASAVSSRNFVDLLLRPTAAS